MAAHAEDSFYLKDGKSQKGQILAEFESHFLVKTSGEKIVEISKTDITKLIMTNGKILRPKDFLNSREKSTSKIDDSKAGKEPDKQLAWLDILSKPEGATVSIDGMVSGTTPLDKVELEPGEHMIKLTREKYLDEEKKITLKKGRKEKIQFKLRERPKEQPKQVLVAYLEVTSNPDSAVVRIDGKEEGFTPLKQLELEPGGYKISVSREGFETQEKKILLKKGKEEKVKFKLKKVPAPAIKKETDLAAAPAKQDTASVPATEAKPAQEPVPSAIAKPDTGSLPALNGYVAVTSKPMGAKVMLDDEDAGRTPVNRLVTQGAHHLKLSLDGYFETTRTVQVPAGKTANLHVKLRQDKAHPVSRPQGGGSVGIHILRWTSAAIALATIPACAYYQFEANNEYESYSSPGANPANLDALHESIRTKEQRALIAGAAGATALTLFGITLFF